MQTDKATELATKAERLAEVTKIYDDFQKRFSAWIEKAKKSNTFLRGSHFENSGKLSTSADGYDYLPEDRKAGDEKQFPSIPYTLGIIDQLCQYIRHDEGDVVVTSEGGYELIAIDPALEAQGGSVGAKSKNELVAKMLTARLDLYRDRAGIDKILDSVAHVAAAQRTAFVVLDWVEDETRQEPVTTKIVKPGSYWFDPESESVQDCDYIGYECDEERDRMADKYGVNLKDHPDTVKVRHHYTRDYTVKRVESKVEVEQSDGAIEIETEQVDVYQYPNAWRYTVTIGNSILYDGEIKTPAGRPPICVYTWRPLPHSMIGVSVMDSTETINRNIDRVVQYIMTAAYKGLPKIGIDVAQIDNPDAIDDNEVQGYVRFDSRKSQGNPFAHIPGSPIPDSLYTLLDTLKQLGAEMSGADGVAFEDASKFKLSGDAIEGLAQDRKGVASRIRDTWANFLADYYELVLRFIMDEEEDRVSLELDTPTGTITVETEMPKYQFDDAEFEARFDVNVFSPQNMPKNPVKRAAYLLQVMDSVMTLAERNPTLARIYVENADLPNSAAIIQYLDGLEAKANDPSAPAQPSHAELDAQAKQAEVRSRMAADVAKSVTDSLEKLSAEAAAAGDYQAAAAIIASMPTKANEAYSQTLQDPQWNQPQIQPQPPQNQPQMEQPPTLPLMP
jgi:hypothetical protein